MFREQSRIDVYRGWLEPLETLCDEIEEILGDACHGFHFVRIKEKFGSCRIYFSFSRLPGGSNATMQHRALRDLDDALSSLIQERVDVAQNATKVRCMICGLDGEIDNRCALVCLCRENGSQGDINPWTAARIGL